MKINNTIGIDMSKSKFDVFIYSNRMTEIFENSRNGYSKALKWVEKNNTFKTEETLFVFEHTGLYSENLATYLAVQDIPFVIVPGLAVKRSLGIARGKSDRIDAGKIAQYAYRMREELEPTRLTSKTLTAIKKLLSLRDRMVVQRAGYKASLKEQKLFLDKKDFAVILDTQENLIHYLSKQIDKVEREMEDLIKSDETLIGLFRYITSINGIGTQTALYMIVYTEGFTKFKTWRQCASYCGTAPFPNTSGSSIRGRTKVSHLANKKMKCLLDLCAKTAIQHNPEMKAYYKKRVEEGKNKRSTINIIRNKLLSRMFAVVERKTPYVELMKYAA
jgi:transposase